MASEVRKAHRAKSASLEVQRSRVSAQGRRFLAVGGPGRVPQHRRKGRTERKTREKGQAYRDPETGMPLTHLRNCKRVSLARDEH